MSVIKETKIEKHCEVILQKGPNIIIIPEWQAKHFRHVAARAAANLPPVTSLEAIPKTNLSKSAYAAELMRLVEIAERITAHQDIDIFDYIPLTAKGLLDKKRNILLADTKAVLNTEEDFAHTPYDTKKLQLRLEWRIISQHIEDIIGKNTDAITLNIGFYDFRKDPEPVFDKNSVPHSVKPVRVSYIKEQDLKPGCVYAEKSGTEYLYLGSMPLKQDMFHSPTEEQLRVIDGGGFLPETQDAFDFSRYYVALRWTKRLQSILKNAKDFTDFVAAMAATDNGKKLWHMGASMKEHPRKFVAKTAEIFDGAKARDLTIATKGCGCIVQYYIKKE